MKPNPNIENIIIDNGNVDWDSDPPALFGGWYGDVEHFAVSQAKDLPELLVEFGFFESKGQAKNAGRGGPIPTGFTKDFKANKVRRICIWNPTEPLRKE